MFVIKSKHLDKKLCDENYDIPIYYDTSLYMCSKTEKRKRLRIFNFSDEFNSKNAFVKNALWKKIKMMDESELDPSLPLNDESLSPTKEFGPGDQGSQVDLN